MPTTDKDFKVKNGLLVSGEGTFNGPVTIGESTLPEHAVRKEYVDYLTILAGLSTIDGGGAETTYWGTTLDGGGA